MTTTHPRLTAALSILVAVETAAIAAVLILAPHAARGEANAPAAEAPAVQTLQGVPAAVPAPVVRDSVAVVTPAVSSELDAPTLTTQPHLVQMGPITDPAQLPTITLPPCATEDSDNCYWDAASMGNGRGTSFVTIAGVTYYPAR